MSATLQPGMRVVFGGPYEQYRELHGLHCTIIRAITETEKDWPDEEVLPAYEVRFDDGRKIYAWPEEVRP